MTLHSEKINIVFLTDCLADLAGGAEKQIYELAKGLDKNKYNVTVVSLDTYGQAPRQLIESTGCRLEIFRVVRIYGLTGLIQGVKFHRFLRKNHIHVLQTYHFSSDIWGTFWGKLAGVPVIISNRRDMGFWRSGIHGVAYRWVNPWVTKMIGNARSIREHIKTQEGIPDEKLDVIYNGVDVPSPQTAKFVGDVPLKMPNDILIMHVANLKPIKGHAYLLKAFVDIYKKHPNVKLVLIGEDQLNGVLQQQASDLGIKDRVIFLGKRKDACALLSLADICVLPSLSEGMSNSILEYMSAGKPVVATNVGGNPELVYNGINGLLVEKEDADGLRSALLTLIEDKNKCLAMGHAGLERVKAEFSMQAMVGRYERMFTDLVYEKKIRILHLVSSGGLFGAERVIINLAKCTKEAVCYVGAVDNVHNPHLEVIAEAKSLGLYTAVFKSRGQLDLTTVFAIKKFLRQSKIDIIHTHNYKSDLLGFCASRLTGTKWVGTNHVWHSTDGKLKFYERLDAFFLKFADKVTGVSQEIKNDLLLKGFKDQKVAVIDNGIQIEKFKNDVPAGQLKRTLFNLNENCFVLAIVGRLAKEKAHDIFFQAAKIVIEKYPDIKFLVIGDGPLRGSLEIMSKELGLSKNVIFTGIRNDMAQVYAMCDLMVNASYIEGLPMTILEAMAAQVPIIATRVGAVPKVIDDQRNGMSLEPGNAVTLASAITGLIEDPQKRKRFADAAYKDVCDRFSDERMAQRYRAIYQEILLSK